ncbi:DNA gyrase inhibitor YacG [Niveibacterium sp. 24ML]|uniref:DNA gyrase inhibitor YacG n=1 Tax=Niveibacterium sp. 24ML TaxID=2985512 RepID=UPI00226EB7D0|nr:DNA gyrase inhibitor YacG [Niveibacterium sp. 24ML]MCX9155872.1 DNA gyrase inhibitor YacG [Niveibacterium sp. 24ML]
MSTPSPRIVKCPTCSKPVEWLPENRWRPFCSERCKLIDLGAWADETYRVPGQAPLADDLPPGSDPRS